MAQARASTTGRRRLGTVGSGVVLLGALAYVGLGNPHSPGFAFPSCPFKALTGWDCPACGGLRMTHDVLHLDFASALVDNAFVLVGLPLVMIWAAVRRRRGQSSLDMATVGLIVAATVTWTIVRNLPGFPLVPTVLGG